VQLPASLTIAIWATASLWLVALLAYAFDARHEIVIAAFVLGCVTAWLEAMKRL
jgi:hypothetical protein